MKYYNLDLYVVSFFVIIFTVLSVTWTNIWKCKT